MTKSRDGKSSLQSQSYQGVETVPIKRLFYGDNIKLLANLASEWNSQISPINKNKINQFLLAVLGNEDDYVDVSTLTLKITNYH